MVRHDGDIAPTVPIGPLVIAVPVGDEAAYTRANAMNLRNTTPGNLTGPCVLTVPCGADDDGIPAGLMLMQRTGREEALLRLGKAAEAVFGSWSEAGDRPDAAGARNGHAA